MSKKSDLLGDFMSGFSAAVQLQQRAEFSGSFTEAVCHSASIIDATLRMGLILDHQLKTRSTNLLENLLLQDDSDKIVSERDIYKKALDKKIIDRALFAKLERLYKQRNKVVHRYIISGITTKEVLDIALEYHSAMTDVSDCVKILEETQIKLGVGMTIRGGKEEDVLQQIANLKHGDVDLAKKLEEGFKLKLKDDSD